MSLGGFLWVYPFWDLYMFLGFSILNLQVYVSCQTLEVFSHFCLEYFFSLFLFYSRTLMAQIVNLLLLSWCCVLFVCLFVFPSVFHLLFRLGNFYCSVFHFTNIFLLSTPLCCWAYPLRFLFLLHFSVINF